MQGAASVVEIVKVSELVEPPTEEPNVQGRWKRRAVLASLVRLTATVIPISAALGAAIVMSRHVSRPGALLASLGWWSLVIAVSTAALLVVNGITRRLLPLAAMLRLSLTFPGRAPSRFAVAAKAGTVRKLGEQLAQAKEHGVDDDPDRGAKRILILVGALNVYDRGTCGHSERAGPSPT